MEPYERARANLVRLIAERNEDYAGLSRMIGRNSAYIQQYIKRGSPRILPEEHRRVLARYFGVSEALFGSADAVSFEPEPLIAIPRFDIKASAGPGTFTDGERPVAHLGFSASWLKQLSGSKPEHLSIIRVRGESMSPTLSDGDDIMVDLSPEGRPLRDGIYVIRQDETLIVKRIAVHPATRQLTISSDNPAFPSWPNCDPATVDVIGRVVWAGRKIS